jgi:Ion channel
MRVQWLIPIGGLAVIAFTLRETFRDLFQPSGSGSLSGLIGRGVFSACKRIRPLLPSAGALAILLTIICWSTLVAIGFAMVYWPNVPDGFHMQNVKHRDTVSKIGISLYYSFDILVTLGQGDITPKTNWTRIPSVAEALLGFSLLTASISWIVLIYPALGRMRTLSRFAANLIRAEEATSVEVLSGDAEQLLGSMAQDVIRTRIDFVHFPLIYYFYATTERASLPEALGHLLNLANHGCDESKPERVRLTAATLRAALEDFAEMLSARFVEGDPKDPAAVFAAFQRDHVIDRLRTASRSAAT